MTQAEGPDIAAFDVDGTLTTRDCVRTFLQLLGGRRAMVAAVLRRPGATARAVARRDRNRFKEIVVGGVFEGRSVAEVDAAGAVFARRVLSGGLRCDTIARLRWHQRRGDLVVLVSASLGPYLRPLADLLELDAVLCADVVADGGRYGHRLDGTNCRGPEKAVRLGTWLAAHVHEPGDLWAYGDSAGDRELLAMATHPVWVGRDPLDAVPSDTVAPGACRPTSASPGEVA